MKQSNLKTKIILFIVFAFFVFFFSNDFGLVDIEKTAIITAVAIDIDDEGKYIATAQIAVPEATDTSTENQKSEISGIGYTIGEAIKDISDVSGWFPQLAFCNLIIIGGELSTTNVIRVVDYFAKTLRVQDSAIVVMAEKKAKDLMQVTSPLDNISSFAIQKILLQSPGFDKDTATMDIKTFSTDYYGKASSSYMPFVKVIDLERKPATPLEESGESDGGSTSQDSSTKGGSGKKYLFDASTTALFKNGIMVGSLNSSLTSMLNAITENYAGSTISLNNVQDNGDTHNYLVTVIKSKPEMKLETEKNGLKFSVSLNLYCKISDENAKNSDADYAKNKPLPTPVKQKIKEQFETGIKELIQTSIDTDCDFLKIKEKLYRFHNSEYSLYKDNFLQVLNYDVKVNVSGQK